MDACVIIGFSYSKTDNLSNRPFIPGIIIDIYHAYKYVQSLIINTNILIITDIIYDININDLRESITNSTVDLEILHFVSDLKRSNYFRDYTSKTLIFDQIRRVVNNHKKIFFYYTGHAANGSILLPLSNEEVCFRYDQPIDSIITFSDIRELLAAQSTLNSKILTILDCCNANGLDLPYKLLNKVYRLTLKSGKVYPRQKFICFSATMIDESSVASKNGSIFSHIFFKNLKNYRNIGDLLAFISDECSKQYDQTVTVHASYPNLKMIWRWLCFKDDIKVKLNPVENYFIIKEKY